MSKINPPSPIRASDYEAIEEALLGSSRGRWFLSEYSRRNRTADTQMLLDAITKLESAFTRPDVDRGGERIRHELIEMSEAISQTRREIAAIKAPHEDSQLTNATEELDAIVQSTEKATSDILQAAEDVQETAWLLRENGVDSASCDRLDQLATDIYTACSFQDITGQRTGKVVNVLRFLENRVNSMVEIWGLEDLEVRSAQMEDSRPDAHLLNGPQLDGNGLDQSDIDSMIGAAVAGMQSGAAAAGHTDPAVSELPPVVAPAPEAERRPSDSADISSDPEQSETLDLDSLDEVKTEALFS